MTFQWTAQSSQRLDAFLADQNPEVSRSRVQKMIKSGGIEVNGEEVIKASFKLKEGDSVFQISEWDDSSEGTEIKPIDLQLPVLYEDDDCMVIDKLAGYAVHPGAGISKDDPTILHGVAYLFEQRSIPFTSDSVLVHRLDKDTTGCLLTAKTADVYKLLQKQFENRDVSKTYVALVVGQPGPPKAIIDAPIGRNLTDRTRMSVLRTSVSREAKTTYRTLESMGNASLLQCDLHTGRTHQIRVHLSSIGHPILGDTTYCSSASNQLTKQYQIEGMCLHAFRLKFLSPTKLKEIETKASLPIHFVSALHGLNMQIPA